MPDSTAVTRRTMHSIANLRQSLSILLEQAGETGPLADVVHRSMAELENVASQLDERRERERLAALFEVSQVLGSSLNLDEVLNQVMDAVIQLTGAGRGFLMLIHEDTGELDLQAARNIERENLDREDMAVSRTVVRQVAETGEPVLTTNAQDDPRFAGAESVILYRLRSIACVPLRVRGKTIGVIYVDNNIQDGLFTTEDLDLFAAFASQAAVAIENARLYTLADQALAERVAELETLQQIDRELNTNLNFERVMDLTLEWARGGTGAETGWIGLLDEEKSVVRIVAGADKGKELPTGDPILQPVIDSVRTMRWPATPEGTTLAPAGIACMVAPILREGSTSGVILMKRDGQNFSDEARSFLERLADHASVAIQNTRLYEAIKEANAAKSQFVSVVSHELRIPMTSIKGFADMLLAGMVGELNAQQLQFLKTIRTNVDRMNALVSDLSDISRIEAGRLKIEIGEVKLTEEVQETIASLQPQIEARSQTLTANLPDDLPPVSTDPARLVQILTNLLSNAYKYTPEGGAITVRAEAAEGFVKLSVTDTGIGISPEDQQQLFTQFFRSEDQAVRDEQGWGLGLHVTRRLVELLGGEIGVESEPGVGSTFWFTAPIADPRSPLSGGRRDGPNTTR